MSDNKRFKRVHEMRSGQIGITDELHNSGDKDFPKNLTEAEAVDLLNEFFDEIQQLKRQLFAAESALIYEYSTNIDEDLKELEKTIYGEH